MKYFAFVAGAAALVLTFSMAVNAQAPTPSSPLKDSKVQPPVAQAQPLYWCDKNGDGLCDYCGRAAGSGRAWNAGNSAQKNGKGSGAGYAGRGRCGMGPGRAAGWGRGNCWRLQPQQ